MSEQRRFIPVVVNTIATGIVNGKVKKEELWGILDRENKWLVCDEDAHRICGIDKESVDKHASLIEEIAKQSEVIYQSNHCVESLNQVDEEYGKAILDFIIKMEGV